MQMFWNNLFRNEGELFYRTTLHDYIRKKVSYLVSYIVNYSSSKPLPGDPQKSLWINCKAFLFSSSPPYSKIAYHSSTWQRQNCSIKGSMFAYQNPPWLHEKNTECGWCCWWGWCNPFGNWHLWEPVSPLWKCRSVEANALGHYFTQRQLFQESGLEQVQGS